MEILEKTYPEHTCTGYSLHYIDQENDKIVVSSQLEWEELNSIFQENNLLKIYVELLANKRKNKTKRTKRNTTKKTRNTKNVKKTRNIKKNVEEEVELKEQVDNKIINIKMEDILEEVTKIFDVKDLEVNEIPFSVKNYFDEGMKIVEDGFTKGCDIFSDFLAPNNGDELKTYEEYLNNLKNTFNDFKLFESELKNDVPVEKIVEPEFTFEKSTDISDSLFNNFDLNKETDLIQPPIFADSYVYDKVKLDIKNENLSDSLIDLRMKWAEQLNELKGMGFLCDDEVLALLLEQSKGNLPETVSLLFQHSYSI